MADETSLEKRAKEKLVEIQGSIPRIHQELLDFIKLVKNIDVYKYTLDPNELAILEKFYPSLFTMVKPGLHFIEDFKLPMSSLVKILALILSGKFTDKELFIMMDKWLIPYYIKDSIEGKPSSEILRTQLMIFLQTLKEFMTRRIYMVRLLSDTSGLEAIQLQASKERGPIALLIQFLAWHLYKNNDELRALFILSELELHIARIKISQLKYQATIEENKVLVDSIESLIRENEAVIQRLTMFNIDLQSQFAIKIHKEKLTRLNNVAKSTKNFEEKERLAKEAANALLLNEEEEKKSKIKTKKTKSKKKSMNLPLLPASAAPTPMPSPPIAPSPSPPVEPAPSPPSLNALLRIPVFIPAPPVMSENSSVERFWTSLDQGAILRLLQKVQESLGIVGERARFYVKGSAAIYLYYQLFRGKDAKPHTSDYDCTLLVDPSLKKDEFYKVRTQAMDIMVTQLVKFVNGKGINEYLTNYIRSLGISFATSVYNPLTQMREYTEVPEPPVSPINIDEKMIPTYFRNSENTYKYGELKETTSPMVLNLRILRTLKEPKNITILSLYLKTNPEIHLVDIGVPFHNYPGPPTYQANAQMSLPDQWANSENNSLIHGISVLSLESLYKEQKLLLKRPIKNEMLIDERLAYIQNVLVPNYIEREKTYMDGYPSAELRKGTSSN